MNYDTPASVHEEWQIGDVILNRYEVREKFEGGGMGLVYRVHHREWQIELAVKSPRSDFFETPEQVENFEREAETWVNLGLHPHIVSCYYVRRLGRIPRIFSEFVKGGTLSEWIRDGRLYTGGKEQALERVLDVSIQVAWGLHHAHEKGLVHQDVKPGNVLMMPDGTAKVSDFGLARARSIVAETSTSNRLAGHSILVPGSGYLTPEYASPEQFRGDSLTCRSDIWSWAVMVLEMMKGDCDWVDGRAAPNVLSEFYGVLKDTDPMAQILNSSLLATPELRPSSLHNIAISLIELYERTCGSSYPRVLPTIPSLETATQNNRAIALIELNNTLISSDPWKKIPINPFTSLRESQPFNKTVRINEALFHWRCCAGSVDALNRSLDNILEMPGPAAELRWLVEIEMATLNPQRAKQHVQKCDPSLAREVDEAQFKLKDSLQSFFEISQHKKEKFFETLPPLKSPIFIDRFQAADSAREMSIEMSLFEALGDSRGVEHFAADPNQIILSYGGDESAFMCVSTFCDTDKSREVQVRRVLSNETVYRKSISSPYELLTAALSDKGTKLGLVLHHHSPNKYCADNYIGIEAIDFLTTKETLTQKVSGSFADAIIERTSSQPIFLTLNSVGKEVVVWVLSDYHSGRELIKKVTVNEEGCNVTLHFGVAWPAPLVNRAPIVKVSEDDMRLLVSDGNTVQIWSLSEGDLRVCLIELHLKDFGIIYREGHLTNFHLETGFEFSVDNWNGYPFLRYLRTLEPSNAPDLRLIKPLSSNETATENCKYLALLNQSSDAAANGQLKAAIDFIDRAIALPVADVRGLLDRRDNIVQLNTTRSAVQIWHSESRRRSLQILRIKSFRAGEFLFQSTRGDFGIEAVANAIPELGLLKPFSIPGEACDASQAVKIEGSMLVCSLPNSIQAFNAVDGTPLGEVTFDHPVSRMFIIQDDGGEARSVLASLTDSCVVYELDRCAKIISSCHFKSLRSSFQLEAVSGDGSASIFTQAGRQVSFNLRNMNPDSYEVLWDHHQGFPCWVGAAEDASLRRWGMSEPYCWTLSRCGKLAACMHQTHILVLDLVAKRKLLKWHYPWGSPLGLCFDVSGRWLAFAHSVNKWELFELMWNPE